MGKNQVFSCEIWLHPGDNRGCPWNTDFFVVRRNEGYGSFYLGFLSVEIATSISWRTVICGEEKKQNSTGKKPALRQPVSQNFCQNIKTVLERDLLVQRGKGSATRYEINTDGKWIYRQSIDENAKSIDPDPVRWDIEFIENLSIVSRNLSTGKGTGCTPDITC